MQSPSSHTVYSHQSRTSHEIDITRTFDDNHLPPAERPISPLSLRGHGGLVKRIAVLPDRALFATGCQDGHIRVFPHDGNGKATVDINARMRGVGGLAALVGDVIISGDEFRMRKPSVVSWSASTGHMLDRLDVSRDGSIGGVDAIAELGPDRFVVATSGQTKHEDLVIVAHSDGRALRVVRRVKDAHQWGIVDIAAHENVVVTASWEAMARVWNAITGERLATLGGHTQALTSVDASANWIVTASHDGSVRVYRNGGDFALFAALRGMHYGSINCISILNNSVLMTGSSDGTLCFTPLASDAVPVARIQCGGAVSCAEVLSDARIAVESRRYCAVIYAPVLFLRMR